MMSGGRNGLSEILRDSLGLTAGLQTAPWEFFLRMGFVWGCMPHVEEQGRCPFRTHG